MYVSNHLSLVEALRPKSNELADQIAEFVAAGGQIVEAEPYHYKPKPITYSNQMPPTPKPFVRRRVEAVPLPVEPTERADVRVAARRKNAEQVMALAPTHTQTEVMQVLGICRRTLLSMSKEFGFQFKRTNHGGYNGPERQKQLLERDEKYGERIKAFKELGITRRQCCGRLAISNKTLERLLAKFGIDYPKARRGSTSCAA
jgi:DNA-directed RNA polymerase subunit N (RpoN/RPB10)